MSDAEKSNVQLVVVIAGEAVRFRLARAGVDLPLCEFDGHGVQRHEGTRAADIEKTVYATSGTGLVLSLCAADLSEIVRRHQEVTGGAQAPGEPAPTPTGPTVEAMQKEFNRLVGQVQVLQIQKETLMDVIRGLKIEQVIHQNAGSKPAHR